MSMHPHYAQLRAMSEDELIAQVDRIAASTQVGTQLYMDELTRRELVRQTATMIRLTWIIAVLTLVVTVLTAVVVLRGG